MRILESQQNAVFLKYFLPLFWFCLLWCLIWTKPCLGEPVGETIAVVAMGSSAIKKDVPAARDAAVTEAMRAAVEKTALEILPIERVTEKFNTLAAILAASREQFIQDYKVLKETGDGTTYRVLIQATVLSNKLKEKLGAGDGSAQRKNLPAVLFMMTERPADPSSMHYWWQGDSAGFQPDLAAGAMKRVFADSGFRVVDEKTIPQSLLQDLQLTAEPTDAQIIEAGKRAKADVVIAGESMVMEAPGRMEETALTFKGTVTARPVFVGSGEALSPAVTSQTTRHTDKITGSRKALVDAGKQAGVDLAPQILTKWQAPGDTGGEAGGDIFINLSGADILSHLAAFRTTLKNIEGVASHQPIEIASDKATVKVAFAGTPQALADALALESFDAFSINISEISGNQLQIELTGQ